MVFFPSLKSSMIESLAVVKAGAWSELFLRSFTESSAAMESALKVESMTARKESEMQFRSEVSQFALLIAEKVVRKDLADDKSQAELVEKLLNEVETKN